MVYLINKRKYRKKSDLKSSSPKNPIPKVGQKSMPRRYTIKACYRTKMHLKFSRIGSVWLSLNLEVPRNKKIKVKIGLYPKSTPIASVGRVHF